MIIKGMKVIRAKFGGTCTRCGGAIVRGQAMALGDKKKKWCHRCVDERVRKADQDFQEQLKLA